MAIHQCRRASTAVVHLAPTRTPPLPITLDPGLLATTILHPVNTSGLASRRMVLHTVPRASMPTNIVVPHQRPKLLGTAIVAVLLHLSTNNESGNASVNAALATVANSSSHSRVPGCTGTPSTRRRCHIVPTVPRNLLPAPSQVGTGNPSPRLLLLRLTCVLRHRHPLDRAATTLHASLPANASTKLPLQLSVVTLDLRRTIVAALLAPSSLHRHLIGPSRPIPVRASKRRVAGGSCARTRRWRSSLILSSPSSFMQHRYRPLRIRTRSRLRRSSRIPMRGRGGRM